MQENVEKIRVAYKLKKKIIYKKLEINENMKNI